VKTMRYTPLKGKGMNQSKKVNRSKLGLAWLVLAVLAIGYAGQAQAQSALTLGGNVTVTTCLVKVALGSGASGTGTGTATPSFAIATVQNSSPTTSASRGSTLNSVTKFTVGLTGSGGTGTCAASGTWNTVFALASPDNTISGRPLIPVTGGAAGVALELTSWSSDGGTQKQAISSYPTATRDVTYSGASNISSQTGLDAVAMSATQTFGVTMIKTAANGVALTSGVVNASVTLGYTVF
jgi:type 1 fimbria pilin